MRASLIALLVVLPLAARAATPQSYDLIASGPYAEPDGTTQPAGTCVGRTVWDGVASYAPAGVTLQVDPQQTVACYIPGSGSSITFTNSPAPLAAFGFSAGQLTQTKGDGTSQTQTTGSGITGSISHAGRTTSPTTLSYTAVAVGGTPVTMAASDSKSGPAQIGDECGVASATATPLPAAMRFTCAITASGIATITAFPTLGIALGAQTVTANVFWRG